MRTMLFLAVAIGAPCISGCSGDAERQEPAASSGSGGAGGGAGDEGAGGAGDGGAPACPATGACRSESCTLPASGRSECRTIACDLPSPCEEVTFKGSGPAGTEMPYQLETPEALACVLESLKNGLPGVYRWAADDPELPGSFGSKVERTLFVQRGRVGISSGRSFGDLGTVASTLGPAALRDAVHFETCAGRSSGDAIWSCLSDWSGPCE